MQESPVDKALREQIEEVVNKKISKKQKEITKKEINKIIKELLPDIDQMISNKIKEHLKAICLHTMKLCSKTGVK